MKTFKPLRYTSHQVALMVAFAAQIHSDFGRQVWESPGRIADMAAGKLAPSEPILQFFNLQQVKGNFICSVS